MQLELVFGPRLAAARGGDFLNVGGRAVPLAFVRPDRARRYILRVRADGTAHVTVPRRGSLRAAREFAERHVPWVARQLAKLATAPLAVVPWQPGTPIWFRGERVPLQLHAGDGDSRVQFGDQTLPVPEAAGDLRPLVERHLWKLAWRELPPRTQAFAQAQGLPLRRVVVRNQRSRWGSCSHRGTVSLNWRLLQMPDWVRDYVIWHELMHLRVMNHSPRFWRAVAEVCPQHVAARRWLRQHGEALR